MQRSLIVALGVALSVAAPGIMSASAQAAPDSYEVPMTAFGQPDIGGIWTNVSMTPMSRPRDLGDKVSYTDEEVAKIKEQVELEIYEANRPTDPDAPAEFRHETTTERAEFSAAGGAVGGYNRFWLDPGNDLMYVNGEARTSILTTPGGQYPKRKADAPTYPRPDRSRGQYDSYETRSLGERCIIGFGRNGGPPMLANGFYNNNYNIVQSPEAVMIEVEMNHDARIIRLNDKHRTDGQRPYFGDSIGWWEGDTLVVETTNFPQVQQFVGSWENLKVTERFTRVGEERLHYTFEVEDPAFWEAPWGGEYEFSPLDGVIYEYACHEGNYALPGILSGGRYQENNPAEK